MAIQLPSINIEFKKKASTTIERSQRGIVALILKDTTSLLQSKIKTSADIPSGLSTANKALVELCLVGNNGTTPKRVDIYTLNTTNTLDIILETIEVTDTNYICYPDASSDEKTSIKTRVLSLREDGVKVKFITASLVGDSEAIINFTTDNIVVGSTTYTNAQYTSRIAGVIASTPLNQSITYVELPEVTSIPYFSKSASETKIGNGELILFKQANVIRIARGVNSLTTLTNTDKTDDFKKIKLVDIMDLIETDISEVLANKYLGKVANTYDNKCVLISAISDYLTELANEELIESEFNVDIDLDSQIAYLKEKGIDTDEMTETEIKKANTSDKVFLACSVNQIDAIEEIDIKFAI